MRKRVLPFAAKICRERQIHSLKWFAKARLEYEDRYPCFHYPGLFAEFDILTGEMRPPDQQKIWTWGDCRGLGIWSYLLAKGIIPDSPVDEDASSEHLKAFYEKQVDFLFNCLHERLLLNDGRLPFIADPATNCSSEDDRNIHCRDGELEPTHVFAAGAFLQYGLLRNNQDALQLGFRFLEECIKCGLEFNNVDHLTRRRPKHRSQGFVMITLGAIVDTLKCRRALAVKGEEESEFPSNQLVNAGRIIMELLLDKFSDDETGTFWEFIDDDGNPAEDSEGNIICDPGHAIEAVSFMAEFIRFSTGMRRHLASLGKILEFVHHNAYSRKNLMFKHIDIQSREGLADRILSGKKYRTAPWWNVFEFSAAAARLYSLTENPFHLEAFQRAFDATEKFYPTPWCPAISYQTLDADTAHPLAINPATANVDPMHSARARERILEAFQDLETDHFLFEASGPHDQS